MRIAFVSPLDLNLYLFRLSWMKAFQKMGHEVFSVTPRGEYFDKFAAEGIEAVEWKMKRGRTRPLSVLAGLKELKGILADLKCDGLHAFTLQGCLYGGLAGRSLGVPSIFLHVTGLGYLFTDTGMRAVALRCLLVPVYRRAFKGASRVVFQNADDQDALNYLVPPGKAVVIKGTGVDVDFYHPSSVISAETEGLKKELGISENTVVITLIGRLLWHKGIREFVEAAGKLSGEFDNLLFLVVGWADEGNPAVVDREFLQEYRKLPYLRFLGKRDDVREVLSLTDIYCLPSYREGTPRTVLEAMAMAKPVVTTDVAGCRQTAEDRKTGILVPVKDTESLADALRILIGDPELRRVMGRAGREKVLREFSDEVVVRQVKALYGEP